MYYSAEELFKTEYGYFSPKSRAVRGFTFAVLNSLPDSFVKRAENGGENNAVKKARLAAKTAADMLGGRHDADLFSEEEQALILSALMLCDGFLYDSDSGILTEHPIRMSFYIRNSYWEPLLPQKERDRIAYAVELHSDQCNKDCGIAGKSTEVWTDMALFVHGISAECGRMFPEIPSLKEECHEADALQRESFGKQMKEARKFLDGKDWNGTTYSDDLGHFIVADGAEVSVPDSIRSAVQVMGQYQKAENASEGGGEVFSFDNFKCLHPEWNGVVYGEKDGFMVKPSCADDGMVPISNDQAAMLGIVF